MPFFLPPKLAEESLSPRFKFNRIEEEEEERRRAAGQRRKVKHQKEFFLEDVKEPKSWKKSEEEEEQEEEGDQEIAPFRLGRRATALRIEGAAPLPKPEVASVAQIAEIRESGDDIRGARERVRDIQIKRLDVLPAISKRGTSAVGRSVGRPMDTFSFDARNRSEDVLHAALFSQDSRILALHLGYDGFSRVSYQSLRKKTVSN